MFGKYHRLTFSSDLEEAKMDSGESLSQSKKLILFMRKSLVIYEIKQNEKHQYIMDNIDQRLDDLYKNWHAEYRDAAMLEECDKIKKFYKPYLEKYESKYKILYHLLQQASVLSTQETTSGITPSLAALDDEPSLK